MYSEVEFIELIASIAGAQLPKDIRALFDTPGGSIGPAASSRRRFDAEINSAAEAVSERQRVVEVIAKKAGRLRILQATRQRPKRGPSSELAEAIRKRLENGGSVIGISRELGCSPKTVRRYRKS